MKRFYLLALALSASHFLFSQYATDFESFEVGDYMGVESDMWTTWSGNVGGNEDVQVTDADASSGTNSIYFQSTAANGGPQDVVVPFGGAYNTGFFELSTNIKVESGKGAYFNFQANETIGQVWAMNLYMVQDGSMYVDDSQSIMFESTYEPDTWVTLEFNINLNTNEWEFLVDGISQGVSQNLTNQVASIDLFPVNNSYGGNSQSGFYIDDFSFSHTPYSLPELNAGVTLISGTNGLAGQDVSPTIQVRNLGTNEVNSFDLSVTYNGETITESFSGLSLASLDYFDAEMSDFIGLIAGESDVVATVSNVNGEGEDDDTSDDSKTNTLDPVVPAPGRVVVGEEGTGTWCQWCPRGAVFMDFMEDTYGEFWAGIAVHNGDPMVNTIYDSNFQQLIGGYPSSLVDRGPDIDPSVMEDPFLERIVIPPAAIITPGAEYDENSGILSVSLSTEFQVNANGSDYNLALVLTEDGVTGTTSGYNQVNAYAGGNNGPMGGYENLPNPVPASQMVYDHVARIITPGFDGDSPFPETVTAGETIVSNYYIELDENWENENLHIIGILIDNNADRIDNAGKATWDEAISNGFILGLEEEIISSFNLFPNPSTDESIIELGETNGEPVNVTVFTLDGRVIAQRNYGNIANNMQIPIVTNEWKSGIYLVQVQVGESVTNQKLTVTR